MSTRDRDVAQLIGLAGARAPLPAERARRIRAAVAPAWLRAAHDSRRRRLRRGLALGVAASLTVAVGLLIWRAESPSGVVTVGQTVRLAGPAPWVEGRGASRVRLDEGTNLSAGQRIVSDTGLAAFRLNDGASLRMADATTLHLVSAHLLELERGTIYVDSDADDDSAPGISVLTPFGRVEEIGTRFEVKVDGDGVRLRVREGAVQFHGARTRARGDAEEELLLAADGGVTRRRVPVHGAEWEWTQRITPAFPLGGRTLGAFLRWAESETGWTVRFADESQRARAEAIVIRGPGESTSPRESLPLVLAACELSHRLDDAVVTIFNAHPSGGTE